MLFAKHASKANRQNPKWNWVNSGKLTATEIDVKIDKWKVYHYKCQRNCNPDYVKIGIIDQNADKIYCFSIPIDLGASIEGNLVLRLCLTNYENGEYVVV